MARGARSSGNVFAASLAWVLLAGAVAAGLAACSMAPHVARPEAEQTLPEAFGDALPTEERPWPLWWHQFNDPKLNRLVDTVVVRNLDLRTAAARVQEVQSRYRIARAPLLPGVQATLDGSRQNTPTNTGLAGNFGGNIPQFPDRFDITTYSASLGFTYELDFWGRVRGTKDAALHEFFATRADYETVRISVVSEAIATYYELVELERQVALARLQVELLEERLLLTRGRYERGLLSSFELYSIEQQFEEARSGFPLLESQLFEAQGRLNILLGRYTYTLGPLLDEGAGPMAAQEPIPAGLPSELLRARPDVMAAAQRLEAARQRVGVARAEQFPRFSLTASGGTQSSELSTLVETSQRFWLFGGSLVAPVFNAGALRANVRVAWAQYEQQASQYEKTVLTAFKEVEAALKAHQKQQERYAFLQEEVAAAQASAESQQRRYERGIGDYLAYLDAQRNLVRVQASLASTERALVNARLGVHRALGGAWVEE